MSVSDCSVLRISDEKTVQLVELYKKEECLWNTTSPDYRIKMKRRQSAEKIARILDLPNFEAKHVMMKFKNLRNSYCQELKKMAMSQSLLEEEGTSPRRSKPRAAWYAVMDSFIRPHLQANYSYSGPTLVINGGIIKREPEPEPMEDPDELWDNPVTGDLSPDLPKPPETCSEPGDASDCETRKRSAPSTRSNSPKRLRSEVLLAESLKEVSTQLAVLKGDLGNKAIGSQKEDYLDNFGKYIASLLRLLPMRKAFLLQPKIVNMIASEVLEQDDNE